MNRKPLGRIAIGWIILAAVLSLNLPQALALSDEHWRKADAAIERGIAFLRKTQNADGSWTPRPGPAVTALAMRVMLKRPDIATNDPAVQKALTYILSKRQEDGGLHDGFLRNYNTAICLSGLALVNDDPKVARAIPAAQKFLANLQWNGQRDPQGDVVDENHPYFGGAGYGYSKHGRPDMSNTQIMLEALYDSGMDCNDPVFQRALVFISRNQGGQHNDLLGDKIKGEGGFIYATSINKDHIGVPQSRANEELAEQIKQGGELDQPLTPYGSMTYAGFKCYLYANLDRDDPRVQSAYDWISRNFTVKQNPGMPRGQEQASLYYYFMTMSRALDMWGASTIESPKGDQHNWANELIDQIVSLQREDGSWINSVDRWMEGDPNLVTCYALIALQHAKD